MAALPQAVLAQARVPVRRRYRRVMSAGGAGPQHQVVDRRPTCHEAQQNRPCPAFASDAPDAVAA
jgi:hypothetical protein